MNKQGMRYKPRKKDFSNEPVNIRDLLLQFRYEKSITVLQAADMAETTKGIWDRMEQGKTDLKLNTLLRLLMNCGENSIDRFLKGEFNREFSNKADRIIDAYNATSKENRKIIDFILCLKKLK